MTGLKLFSQNVGGALHNKYVDLVEHLQDEGIDIAMIQECGAFDDNLCLFRCDWFKFDVFERKHQSKKRGGGVGFMVGESLECKELIMENDACVYSDCEPSRLSSGYTVDFGFGNLVDVDSKTLGSEIDSDHESLLFSIPLKTGIQPREKKDNPKWIWSIKSMDLWEWGVACEFISRDWYIQSQNMDLENKVLLLNQLLLNYAWYHIPRHRYFANSKPFWNPHLTKLRKERNHLKRKYQRSETLDDQLAYKSKKKEYQDCLQRVPKCVS